MVFFLSRLLRLANIRHEELGSELLYIISAKVSRRIKTISNLPQSHWSKPFWETLIGTHDRLDKRCRASLWLYSSRTILPVVMRVLVSHVDDRFSLLPAVHSGAQMALLIPNYLVSTRLNWIALDMRHRLPHRRTGNRQPKTKPLPT